MKTFETPKVIELGMLQQIVLSDSANQTRNDAIIHASSGMFDS